MNTFKFLKGIAANLVLAVLFATLFSATLPQTAALFTIMYAVGVLMYITSKKSGGRLAFDGLAVEAWIPLILEDFYPKASFMQAATDMSGLVDNDKINLAESGTDPTVLKNNTAYPIASTDAADTPKAVELEYYDTTSTTVRNAVAIELMYDQRAHYASKHKKALAKKMGIDAAYAYAPAGIDAYNKIINLGAGDSFIDGIIDLQKEYNLLDDDGTDRNLVLNPTHMAKIAKEDKVLYKGIMAMAGSEFYGFKIWTYSKNPIYISATNVKAALGVAFNGATHKLASFSFLGSEVMKAQGTIKLFSSLNDPREKGDIFNFQMRGLAASLRNKYGGAILQ